MCIGLGNGLLAHWRPGDSCKPLWLPDADEELGIFISAKRVSEPNFFLRSLLLRPGDRVLLGTDGVPGIARLDAALQKSSAEGADAQTVLNRIYETSQDVCLDNLSLAQVCLCRV